MVAVSGIRMKAHPYFMCPLKNLQMEHFIYQGPGQKNTWQELRTIILVVQGPVGSVKEVGFYSKFKRRQSPTLK